MQLLLEYQNMIIFKNQMERRVRIDDYFNLLFPT